MAQEQQSRESQRDFAVTLVKYTRAVLYFPLVRLSVRGGGNTCSDFRRGWGNPRATIIASHIRQDREGAWDLESDTQTSERYHIHECAAST